MKYEKPLQKGLAKQKEINVRISRFSIKIIIHTNFSKNDFFSPTKEELTC